MKMKVSYTFWTLADAFNASLLSSVPTILSDILAVKSASRICICNLNDLIA